MLTSPVTLVVSIIRTGDGEDAIDVSGDTRTLYVRSGDDNDEINLSGDVRRTARVSAGDGDDELTVLGDVNLAVCENERWNGSRRSPVRY